MMTDALCSARMTATVKTTLADLHRFKKQERKFPVLTCYDYTTARLTAQAGIEVLLVGDTYGEVCLGHSTTLPVKLDHLLTITEAVRRGAPDAVLIGDMPYMTYQVSQERAIINGGRFMAEAGCDCVKLEVDRRQLSTVEAMATASIPVVAHIGLKPQSIHRHGGYKAQGKTARAAQVLIEDADLMEQAGAMMLLLEAVPYAVAQIITQRVSIPVIGCVSGPHCDGTVVVLHDMLGYGGGHPPRTVRQYAQVGRTLVDAFRAYGEDVSASRFPSPSESIAMPDNELQELYKRLGMKQAQDRARDSAGAQL